MRQVINALKRMDAEKRISVIRLEVDYELFVLFEALQRQDEKGIKESKEKLESLRIEMLRLEV